MDAPTDQIEQEDAWGEDGMTLKQRLFAELYVTKAAGNASKAAELAGYSKNCVAEQGHENLRKPQVRAYIGRLLARQGMTPEFLKSRLAELACSNFNSLTTLDDDGHVVVDLDQAAKMGALGQIKEAKPEVVTIDGKERVVYRVVMQDPLKAIELLLKMYGTLFDKHVVSGPQDGPVEVRNSGPDLSKLSEEELSLWASLLGKAGGNG